MRVRVSTVAAVAVALLAWGATAQAQSNNIFTAAGTGGDGSFDDGGQATATQVSAYDVKALPDGGFLIATFGPVKRVSPDGTITTVNGTERNAAPTIFSDGIDATPDGTVLVADSFNHRVWRVAPDGTVTVAAGTGAFSNEYGDGGFSGDGGLATAADLYRPTDVAVTRDGGFLIADSSNNRVRRVSRNGIITTVAGSGSSTPSGDGGPATAAGLHGVRDVAVSADDGFLIAEFARIRRVSPNGTISTVAGTGIAGFAGDSGPATAARLNFARGVVPTADGGFLISDHRNHRVRRVSPRGIITTVAGNGTQGNSGDGGPATLAQISPSGLDQTPDGGFLIANANAVRFVDALLAAAPVTCRGTPATLTGTESTDRFAGTARDDVVAGLGGDDVVMSPDVARSVLGGRDIVCGGGGADTIRTGDGEDVVDAGSGRDAVASGGAADDLAAGVGNDQLQGEDGADALSGDEGSDKLFGGPGPDRLFGEADPDLRVVATVIGAAGDTLSGGDGDDLLDGGDGRDSLRGEEGNDTLRARDLTPTPTGAGDVVFCGNGFDTVDADLQDAGSTGELGKFPDCEAVAAGPIGEGPNVRISRHALTTHRGEVTLVLRCPARLARACRGRLTLRLRGARRTRAAVRAARYRITPGRSERVRIRLPASERARLARGHALARVAAVERGVLGRKFTLATVRLAIL